MFVIDDRFADFHCVVESQTCSVYELVEAQRFHEALERIKKCPQEGSYSQQGWTPLHLLCWIVDPMDDNQDVVVQLAEALLKAHPYQENDSESPLDLAVIHASEPLLECLLSATKHHPHHSRPWERAWRYLVGRALYRSQSQKIGGDGTMEAFLMHLEQQLSSDLNLHRVWNNLAFLLRRSCGFDAKDPTGWLCVLACLTVPQCPPDLFRFALMMTLETNNVVCNDAGDTPLHLLLQSTPRLRSRVTWGVGPPQLSHVDILLGRCARMTRSCNLKSELPLHLALKCNHHDVSKPLIRADPWTVGIPDGVTGYCPFVLAVLNSNTPQDQEVVDTLYQLLEACPEVERMKSVKAQ